MPLHLRAYAKTNLYLAITGKRHDGYHDISTIFQNISLADDLIIDQADNFSLTIETAGGLPALAPTPDNLILKAARALQQVSGAPIPGAHFHLTKRIPFGAGMGGGSADAAAAIIGLNRIYNLELSDAQLHAAAVNVGMDVPFFLNGGTAMASGRGEILAPIPNTLSPWLLMLFPEFAISTRLAYAAWQTQARRDSHRPPITAMQAALASGDWDKFRWAVFNEFEALLAAEYPRIEEIKAELIQAGCDVAWLSGSGSAVIGAGMERNKIEGARAALQQKYPHVQVMQFAASAIEILND